MRVLGMVCVAVSLLLGSGGVAYRSQADVVAPLGVSSESAQIGMTEIRPRSLVAQASTHCPLPPPNRPLRIELSSGRSARGIISINTRGYNYQRPAHPLAQPSAPPASAAK